MKHMTKYFQNRKGLEMWRSLNNFPQPLLVAYKTSQPLSFHDYFTTKMPVNFSHCFGQRLDFLDVGIHR